MLRLDKLPSSLRVGFLFIIFFFYVSQNFAFPRKDFSVGKSSSDYSSITPLNLSGDTNLCLVIGVVLGTYSAGGEVGDVYEWTVTNAQGDVIDHKRAGGIETYRFLYRIEGKYNVNLIVSRGAIKNFYEQNLSVTIQKGPKLVLLPDYLLCGSEPTRLTALDPDTPDLNTFTITWTDNRGNVISIGNDLLAEIAGTYNVSIISNSCEINGSTYVAPPLDFIIVSNTEKLCEGSSATITTDNPIAGEWFIQKEGTLNRESFGKAYEFSLNYNDLPSPGKYFIIFVVSNPNYIDCPTERISSIEVLDRLKITTTNIVKPDDCNSTNGSFDLVINSDLDSLSIVETGFSQAGLKSGSVFSFVDLKPGFYTINAFQNGCKNTRLVSLEAANAPLPTDIVDITWTDEICNINGINKGGISLIFNQVVLNGSYRILSPRRGVVKEGPIVSPGSQNFELVAGTYYVEITIDGCIYSFTQVTISNKPEVTFTVPLDFTIRESFRLVPETNQKLIFTLIYPDESQKTVMSGEGFDLTLAGLYSITGVDQDPNSNLCPKTIRFTVSLFKPFTYQPELNKGDCFDPISYTAKIEGLTYGEVSIRWLNSNGDIVGRLPTFYPFDADGYSLSVQPLKSGFALGDPIPFSVVAPVTSIDMELTASKLCSDPEGSTGSTLAIVVDTEVAKFIEWVFYDASNEREELVQFNDHLEIQVDRVGSYEAVAYNSNRCEIAREIRLVEVSTLQGTPNLEDSYAICSRDNSINPIDPGEYEIYEWYFGDKLVSEMPTYEPDKVGDYVLVVTNADNCQYVEYFSTFDACNFQVVFPNAMELENPFKDFRVMVSQEVKEAELFITNRQGELIFYSLESDISYESSILHWDGRINGKNAPLGNYSILLILKNPTFGIEQKVTGSLLIMD